MLTPVSLGTAVATVTATDPGGLTATQPITVTVGQVDVPGPPPVTNPDLVVASAAVSNSGPAVGATFTLSATVRNDGDGESQATTLRYYRSTDATISASDTAVGTDAVEALAASGSSSESADLTALAAGTYSYGACVDAVADESDTTNNCSAAVQVTVRAPGTVPGPPPVTNPDLVVASASVSNSGPAVGATFTLSATVRNDGDGESQATTLRYYRSSDATISASDTAVGTDAVSALGVSGSGSASVDLTAPAAGTYSYGACVDAVAGESDTTNNCSTAVQVTVRAPGTVPEPPPVTTPDLVVALPTVSDDGPAVGAAFTLSATVRNDGDGESQATTLRYYRSTDATISASDTAVGTDAVEALAASGSSSESADLTALAAGTYYYGACVDAVADESDTTNNCSAAVQVTVRAPGTVPGPPPVTNPDLVVASASVSNSGPAVGATFTLSATVRNDGDGESQATTLRYYRSTDATISTSDTSVGTHAVAVLGASGSGSASVDLTAPAAGTYSYGACVDAVAGESDTTNNCSAAVQVTVRAPGTVPEPPPVTTPDLVVASPTVSDDGPAAGAAFTLSATVRNDGDGESQTTTLRYYRSADAAISASDTELGTDAVEALSASGSSAASVDLTAPSSPGTYYYGAACVDAVTGESDTANNCSSSVQVDVPEPPPSSSPDLEVGAPSVDDSSPATGASFTLSATVRNTGAGESRATTLRYYRSTDATISASDTEVGTDAVAVLAASGTSAESIALTAPSTAGAYYYGACVDAVTGESDTANNCSSSVQVDVPEPPPSSSPDLEVGAPSVDDSSPATGASFTLSATVSNTGAGESTATTLRYYRSTDATISASDTEVGTDAVAVLAASGTSAESIALTAPSTAGAYYYGACVDAVTGESDTTNNCSTAVQVDVKEPPSDLEVGAPTVSDSSPVEGGSFTLSATVSNTGAGESAATTLRYYRSADAAISASDTELGTDAVKALAASGTSAASVDLTAPSTAGAYYYGACVDTVTGESDTTNNCSTSVQVTVVEQQSQRYPDLTVGSTSLSASDRSDQVRQFEVILTGLYRAIPGETFNVSSTATNAGDGESAATTMRFYRSSDITITPADTLVGTAAVEALGASESARKTLSTTAPSTLGRYYYGACVDAVTDESDTTNNCSASVTLDVVSADAPDLVVQPPTASSTFQSAGATFTLSAYVRNLARVREATSEATTLRWHSSTDANIETSDTEVGTDAVPALGPLGRSLELVELTAPSTLGMYFYGACVDPVARESPTDNNCSHSVSIIVTE